MESQTIMRIKNAFFFTLLLTLPLLHGCGLASVTKETGSQPSQVEISLVTQLSVTPTASVTSNYEVGIVIKNITDKPITIVFEKDPVSVSYTIVDDQNQIQCVHEEGTLASLSEPHTILPGESFTPKSQDDKPFTYSKTSVAEWRINAVTTYYIDSTLHTDRVTTAF